MKTYNCPPTLTDTQVLEFCKKGYLILEGVVPDEVNRRTVSYLDEHPHSEPTEVLDEAWFVESVICQPQAAGAVRALLGRNLALPILMSNHRTQMPAPAQSWHRDGGSQYGPAIHYLQVFYYPETCPREMGPTELLPGSHHLFSHSGLMSHYGGIKGSVYAAVPAGSIIITQYAIWHRRSVSTATGIRNLLKYNYFRTAPPQRDWLADPAFDFTQVNFRNDNALPEKWYDSVRVAQLFLWLCGLEDRFEFKGGQSWPITAGTPYQIREGLPPVLASTGENT